MYNNSYKRKKGKFRFNFKFKRNPNKRKEKGVLHLQIIQVICGVLALVLSVTLVIVLISALTSSPNRENNETEIIESSDESRKELLTVVNRNNPLSEDFVPRLSQYKEHSVNVLAIENLEKLVSDAENNNLEIKVSCAYVPYEEQDKKFQNEYNRLFNEEKMTQVTAEAKAQSVVSRPGESEFQTGLLITFDVSSKALKWLERYSVDYGFVERYTYDKKSITGMKEDPYTYRYVGVEDAKMMRSLGMCLNEYNSYINIQQG